MRFEHLACDTFVNASEELAFQAVRKHITNIKSEYRAIVITNMAHAIGNTGQPDEIDMIVITTGGVLTIEVKALGSRQQLKRALWDVEDAADLITKKTKRVAGRLRDIKRDLRFVSSAMIFTKERGSLAQSRQLRRFRGVPVAGLGDLKTPFLWRRLR